MTVPLVPAVSQWDGSFHESRNCTCASGARLMLYGQRTATTGGQVRAKQSDQTGGTSLPDVMRALHNGWSFEPFWAAPNDTNAGRDPIPRNRVADYIDVARLRFLLAGGYMVIVQGDYGDLPLRYREQASFVDDHAFTVDAYSASLGYYVVDTLPRYGTGYKGRWIPASALHSYAFGLAGTGRIYAAWAKPLVPPDTTTEEAMWSIAGVDGPFPATVDANTPVYENPTGPEVRQTLNAPSQPFTIVGASEDGKRWAIYGRTTSATKLGWVAKERVNR